MIQHLIGYAQILRIPMKEYDQLIGAFQVGQIQARHIIGHALQLFQVQFLLFIWLLVQGGLQEYGLLGGCNRGLRWVYPTLTECKSFCLSLAAIICFNFFQNLSQVCIAKLIIQFTQAITSSYAMTHHRKHSKCLTKLALIIYSTINNVVFTYIFLAVNFLKYGASLY